jgi:uncharacterized 2Fe-2S/4Fe-4S cluster protein (DUF4445 family)
MSLSSVKVIFKPSARYSYNFPGTSLLEAAARAGLVVNAPCGGEGTCGKCLVQIIAGQSTLSPVEVACLSEVQRNEGWRLACQAKVTEELTVSIPEHSLFGGQHQILETSKTQAVAKFAPSVEKVYLKMPPPDLQNDGSDWSRIQDVLGPVKIDLSLMRVLPERLRKNNYTGTAVLSGSLLIAFEADDTTRRCYAAAFDVGTTTIVGSLLDLVRGEEVAVVSRMNPQTSMGDDVLTRIIHVGGHDQGLSHLQNAIVDDINAMVTELCQKAAVHDEEIYEVSFAGNTTMEHLLCGIDPTALGQVPFTSAFSGGLHLKASELGIKIHGQGRAYVFPIIGGFVGGDTVAGMLAAQITRIEGPALMIDIGTNGEIVLVHNGNIWAASTAAGPAFEGAGISCGMRATNGAIEKVFIDDDLRCSVIGNIRPAGLCGSGLIDLVAELLRTGIVTPQGRMLPQEELPESLPEFLKRRVRRNGDGAVEFLLSSGCEGESTIVLTEQDVRELQLASGAIRAGILLLLKRAGLEVLDLKHVLVAGGFGSFIRRDKAQRIGLLPVEIDHNKIQHVGNVSLGGAQWVLLSKEARSMAESLARDAEHIELSRDDDFAMTFAMAMTFPEETVGVGS